MKLKEFKSSSSNEEALETYNLSEAQEETTQCMDDAPIFGIDGDNSRVLKRWKRICPEIYEQLINWD